MAFFTVTTMKTPNTDYNLFFALSPKQTHQTSPKLLIRKEITDINADII
jgi:hypothetical protein